MILSAAKQLNKNVKAIDALNVFPVPDGDTGTNMNLSFISGVNELKKKQNDHVGHNAEALSRGLLMGARGNSGVILSQLFRGFSKKISSYEEIDSVIFAEALTFGVKSAYSAVMKPVEGTILTVAKDVAHEATILAKQEKDILKLMEAIIKAGEKSLANTPNLLPVLKEVGVVDAGGKGLLYIYKGFLIALKNPNLVFEDDNLEVYEDESTEVTQSAQSKISAEDIEFGYCTEFFINLTDTNFPEKAFKEQLSQFGDSLVVIHDEDIVKVHLHSNEPGTILNAATKYGGLTKIKIENMREQHSHLVVDDKDVAKSANEAKQEKPLQEYGIIAVGMGDGIIDIFKSLGVDVVISGGQTMNPSTEDMVKAIGEINAKNYIILPNNSNIIMAAEQTIELVDKPIAVIPSKSIPQGISALLNYDQSAALMENKEAMIEGLSAVKTGQVTYSIRDTKLENLEINEGDFIGLANNKIIVNGNDLLETSYNLLDEMIEESDEILTILYGEDVSSEEALELSKRIQKEHPHLEIEIHNGMQPIYNYIFGIE
jgi:DAK2 domain fusion protein YloV